MPRTIALLFGILLDHEHERALKDLYKILDLVTPLYKHRMDDLPAQQQKIIDAVAKHWEPITVKELAAKTRLISKTLSAQLNQLEKEQIVIKNSTENKNKTYLIRERFWNIWYLMRYGKKDDKEKVIWLVRFLESWLSNDDLKKRIDSFVDKVQNSRIDEAQLSFFSKVYASLNNLPIDSKLKLKSIEHTTKEKIILSNEEWDHSAEIEYSKGNYEKSLDYILNNDNWDLNAIVLFEKIVPNLDHTYLENHLLPNISDPLNRRSCWGMFILIIKNYIRTMRKSTTNINYNEMIETIKIFFCLEILFNNNDQRMPNERLISLVIISILFGSMIKQGLYNTVYKLIDEASLKIGERTVFLKDQWKPFYLAVKYLYHPEELAKQPSELNTEAFSIANLLLP